MGDVINMGGMTTAPDTPENVLEKAKDWNMKECIVIGLDEDGDLTFGGTSCELRDILHLLKLAEWFVQEYDFKRHI